MDFRRGLDAARAFPSNNAAKALLNENAPYACLFIVALMSPTNSI